VCGDALVQCEKRCQGEPVAPFVEEQAELDVIVSEKKK
jgi:hypothetical protein